MTKKTRRFIFWIFFVFFAVVSISVTLFAEGWRFDFKSLKIVKVGGIFINTSAPDADIYVNNRYVGKTSGILNYTKLIGDLTPKNYNVFVYKDGYYPWNKVIGVKSGLVAELPNIVLFYLEPKKIKIADLPAQFVRSFTVSGGNIKIEGKKSGMLKVYGADGKFASTESTENFNVAAPTELIAPDKTKSLYSVNGKILVSYLKDAEKQNKKAGEKELIATADSPILFLNWLNDSGHIAWFENNALFITEINNLGGKRNGLKLYLNIKPPFFLDAINPDLYFFENNKDKLTLYKISLR